MATVSDARRARYRQEVLDNAVNSGKTTTKMAYYKLLPGTFRLRVLPGLDPASADKDFYCKGMAHYFVNPNNPKIPVTCPRSKNPATYCPVCDEEQKLRKSANKADNLTAEKIRGKTRYYLGVLVREGEDRGKVMVYSAPKAVYMKLLTYLEDAEYGDITHPIEGYDIKITRTGTGKDTRYDLITAPKPEPISEDPAEVEQILTSQPELWRFREAPSVDEIKKFMNGEITRFTTGGFAVKADTGFSFPDEAEAVPDSDGVPTVSLGETHDSNEPSGPDSSAADGEADVPPIVKAAKKKFSNLDKIKEELK
jgi:hypothetical protein